MHAIELLAAEEEVSTLRQQLQERDAEVQQLQAQGTSRNNAAPAARAEGNDPAPMAMHPPTELPPSDVDRKAVRAAGRRCSVLHMPWMQGDSLFDTDVRDSFETIIARIDRRRRSQDNNSDDSASDQDDPVADFWHTLRFDIASPVEIAEEVMAHMDLPLAKRWFEPWFCVQFREGMRKARSEASGDVANHREQVFKLSEDDFGERRASGLRRRRGPGAIALLEGDAYLWAPNEPNNPTELHERFFRSECIIRAVKLFLLGPSSLESAKRSPQAGRSRLDTWHIKSITPSILSFMAVVVHFVLSGDVGFDIVTTTANYADMYEANLRMLRAHKQRYRRHFNDLISLYNQQLFPDQRPAVEEADRELAGMSEARRAFYLSMIEEPHAPGSGSEDDAAD